MMRIALVAFLTFILACSAEKWMDWGECQAQPSSNSSTSVDAPKEAHQVIRINNYTGKLEVNPNATLWAELESETNEVYVVALYGAFKEGTSTLASMLGCAMNGAKPDTTQFPATKEADEHTTGVWASSPFKYRGRDGKGAEKSFVILDIQGVDQSKTSVIPGISKKVYNDAGIKIVAMLSEVVSEFVYVTNRQLSDMKNSEFDRMGLAFKTSRENLVRTGEEFQSEADKEVNIRSTDHPGLIIATREMSYSADDDLLDENLEFRDTHWEQKALADFSGAKLETDLRTIMLANFKNHTVQGENTSFLYNPLSLMDHSGDFDWFRNPEPFKRPACEMYQEMEAGNLNCTVLAGNKRQPSAPAVFKVMLDNLAADIHEHAPERELTWADKLPQKLTGHRLKGILEASVEEINKAGPVRDNELWRLLIEDRCAVDLVQKIKRISQGLYTELQKDQVDLQTEVSTPIDPKDTMYLENKIRETNITFGAKWKQMEESEIPLLVQLHFEAEALQDPVRESCEAEGVVERDMWDLRMKRLFSSMYVLGEKAIVRRQIHELDLAQQEIDRLARENLELWWQANAPYMVAFAALGLLVFYVFVRMFGQVCTTCRSCLACCEDLQTQDHTEKVITKYRGADGVELQGTYTHTAAVPFIPGVAVAPASVSMGAADPAISQRIEELEAVVMQLASRVKKEDLEDMNLKEYGQP